MSSEQLGRKAQMVLTNKSGSNVARGAVVAVARTDPEAFTTVTISQHARSLIGVVVEPNGIASNARGMVCFGGPVERVNLTAVAAVGDYLYTHTTPGQARPSAVLARGAFGVALESGASPKALLWGQPTAAAWSYVNYDPADYPLSPNALDDEFDGASLDARWTVVNNPTGEDAISLTKFPGSLWVGLPELSVTDNFSNAVRVYQTPPAWTQTWEVVIRCSVGLRAGATGADRGEFAGVGIYLASSASSQFIWPHLFYIVGTVDFPVLAGCDVDNGSGGFVGAGGGSGIGGFAPGQWCYIKLVKNTASAYTSSNQYIAWASANGVTWHKIADFNKAFSSDCNEIGLLFRHPKSVTDANPNLEAAVDFFRRVA